MRLISKFRDYYDSLQDPTDKNLTYVRQSLELQWDDPVTQQLLVHLMRVPANFKWASERLLGADKADLARTTWHGTIPVEYVPPKSWREYAVYADEIVLFCGKLYRGIRYTERWTPSHLIKDVTKVYWDKESFLKDHVKTERTLKYRQAERDTERFLDAFFTPLATTNLVDLHFATRSPVIGTKVSHEQREQRVAELNPCLNTLQFYRCVEPTTAFQELSMFLGGVLANNDKPDPVDNRYKILAHGFDLQTSFRKEPTKVHR